MKNLVLLVLSLLMIGCGQSVVKMDVPGIESSKSIALNDLRPANEKQSKIFSYSITSEAYGVYRKGDETLDPPMKDVLRHRIYEKYGNEKIVSEVVVHHMVVYWNAKSSMRSGALFGAIGAAASSTSDAALSKSLVARNDFEALSEEEYKRAFYTEMENPEGASVFVIYIDAEINGKRVFVKTISPSKSTDDENPYARAVDETIDYFLAQYKA